VAEQPGDLRPGDAEMPADLILGHAAVKAREQDLLLEGRQFRPVRGDSLHIEHVLHPRVLPTQNVSQQGRSGLAGCRRVQ
jgi:hypothetical protein